MSRFGFTCFPSNSTTAEKRRGGKKLECLTTFISHMMGVIMDRAEQNVVFSHKVTENIPPGQRTSPITNVHRSLPVVLPAVVCSI